MRDLLRQVGAKGLTQCLEHADEAEPLEKEKDCGCQGKRQYLFRREAVILSVFGRVSYKRRYYTCPCQSSHVNAPPIRGNNAPVIRGNDAPP